MLPHEGVSLQAGNSNLIPISRTLGALRPHLIRSLAGGQATRANIGAKNNLDALGLGRLGHRSIIVAVGDRCKGGGDESFFDLPTCFLFRGLI